MDLKAIIEAGIEKYNRKMVGSTITPQIGNQAASRDAIRHFACGSGDLNPLWVDEAHGRQSPYGDNIAPPMFLNAVSEGQAIVGLPGLVATYVGATWEWQRAIRVDDRFSVGNHLLPLEDKTPAGQPRRLLQSGVISYRNQRDQVAGTCQWFILRTEAGLAGGKAKAKDQDRDQAASAPEKPAIAIHSYSEAELVDIYAALDAEEVRGATPRWWDQVREGDPLTPVVKGPLGLADMVAFAMGINWHRMELAHGAKLRHLRQVPGLSYKDPLTNTPEPIGNSHFYGPATKVLMGSPVAIDIGFQRLCWLGHLVTNWMGDAGFLRKLDGRIKEFVRFGDTNWVRGKVVRRWVEDRDHLVELELWSENQRGQVTMTGSAQVILPAPGQTAPARD